MQTILGSGGAIGIELAKSLRQHTNDIRLVSRNPKKINEGDVLHPADLTDPKQVMKAVEGSSVCYVTLGFDYNTKLWQEKWLPFMESVTAACMAHKSKLVFFDNVYALAPSEMHAITETSLIGPSSKKGAVRAAVDKHIINLTEKGKLEAIIARAPDFFGPVKDKSLVMNLIYDNMVKGKAAQWFCNADFVHTTGYTPDLGAGTALLGNTPDAFNQVWNLPVDPERITGRQWVELFAAELQGKTKVQVLPVWGLKVLGLFVPILKEMVEMCYQYDRDYYFDSSKFNKRFSYTPTPNAKAVAETVARLKVNG